MPATLRPIFLAHIPAGYSLIVEQTAHGAQVSVFTSDGEVSGQVVQAASLNGLTAKRFRSSAKHAHLGAVEIRVLDAGRVIDAECVEMAVAS